MKFCWCTLLVGDLDASVKFYTEMMGLSVERRFQAGPGKEICFLGSGETRLELISGMKSPEPRGLGVTLGFEAGPLEKALEFVKSKGVAVDSGPFQPGPEVKFFFVKDPDGYKVQFVENLKG